MLFPLDLPFLSSVNSRTAWSILEVTTPLPFLARVALSVPENVSCRWPFTLQVETIHIDDNKVRLFDSTATTANIKSLSKALRLPQKKSKVVQGAPTSRRQAIAPHLPYTLTWFILQHRLHLQQLDFPVKVM